MKDVSNKINFPDLEKEVLAIWRSQRIFEKSIEQRPTDREFGFYDGPPFATGLPHYGHILAGTIKDVVPRYKTMRGFRVERRFGWDTHGLPVEFEVEQSLKLSGRPEIEAFGIGNFIDECRSIVLRYTKEWRETVERMGRWIDFDNDYKTMDLPFMESVWWVFKQLWEKGLIYEGRKVVPYSWRLSTPLSNFEANLNYQDTQDPSVTFKCAVSGEANSFFLAWTTTPWTLPSNLALCVGAEMDYVKIQVQDSGECYYLSKTRLEAHFETGTFRILNEWKGKELKGRTYIPLFDFADGLVETKNCWKIVCDDYVSDESGTGIVHQAPAFGEDDLRIGLREGLPVFDPVDENGNFKSYMGFIAGLNIKEADKLIIRQLKDENRIFRHETIQHSYPFCWRTDSPLIYKGISTWFVKVESFKETMVQRNQEVLWMPSHIKDGRFGNWLENARDWAISRNRFWGTPLPVWKNEEGEFLCFGSVAELEEATGTKLDDLHKHIVDELVIERDGKVYKRIPEVLDCWFESGSMPYAQEHYPFENKEKFDSNFPADFICEGLDQTRGWFYTLAILGNALFGKPPFQNVIVNGMVLAEDGKKMSKRLKNYPDPTQMLDDYGADAIRLYMLNSPAVRGDDLRFSEKGLVETTRSLLLPLWNALAFLTTYAKIDQWEPDIDNLDLNPSNPLDRWILSKLQELIEKVGSSMDLYDLNKSVAPFVGFIELLTNWYIRRSRRRFWKSEQGRDKQEAYAVLYHVLLELSKVVAPFIPFIADGIYLALRDDSHPESVHLDYFPEVQNKYRDIPLERKMDLILSAVSMGRSLRNRHQLKIRQPLAKIFLITRDPEAKDILNNMEELITEELNIKEVMIADNEEELVSYSAKANFKVLGSKLGKKMKQTAQEISKLGFDEILRLRDGQSVTLQIDGEMLTLESGDVLIQRHEKEGLLVLTENNLTVALDTDLTEELVQEGFAREFINKVQNMRKEQMFDVMDRIQVRYQTTEPVQKAVDQFNDFIKTETLANFLESDSTGEQALQWDINGELCKIEVQKV
ncbi:MAG: isoleucine--tRNA ligase [SAR324 cluster bacterium]|nr:isoleucine--tRNA ligase [SAR324 cluster bacterium]